VMRKLWSLLGEQKLALPAIFSRLIRMTGPTMSDVPQVQSSTLVMIGEFCSDGCKNPELMKRTRVVLLDVFDSVTEELNQCRSCLNIISRLRNNETCKSSSDAQSLLDTVEQLINLKQKLVDTRATYLSMQDRPITNEEKCAALDAMLCSMHDVHDFFSGIPQSEMLCTRYLELISNAMKEGKKTDLGLALKQLSQFYSWNDSSFMLPSFVFNTEQENQIPALQPVWKTKEDVSFATANALRAGDLQEDALDVLEDIRRFQVEEQFDYLGAAKTLRLESENAKDLAKGGRIPRDYYHVGFYGSDLPPEIKNRDFIYTARPLEKLLDFQERIQIAYPNSEVLKKTDAPGPEYTETPGMKLLITNVAMCNDKELDTAFNAPAPEGETKDLDKSTCSVFVYSKPVRKKKLEKGENEFRSLYVQKQYFFTSSSLPNSRVRTEIVQRREVMVSPIQNACNMVNEKNEELRALIKKYDEAVPGEGPSVQPLAMAMNGCIMAAVNGGLAMYQEAFLNEAFRQEEPEEAVHQSTLLSGINEQMDILGHGLQTFERHCSADMADLLGILKEMFGKMCATWTEQSATNSGENEGAADSSVSSGEAVAGAQQAEVTEATETPQSVQSSTEGGATQNDASAATAAAATAAAAQIPANTTTADGGAPAIEQQVQLADGGDNIPPPSIPPP